MGIRTVLRRCFDMTIGRLQRLGGFAVLLIALVIGGSAFEAFAQEATTDQSLGLFEELVRNPDDVNANLAYAKALQAQGRAEDAGQIYLKVLTLSPGNPIALAAIAAPAPPAPAQTDYTFRTGGAIETNSARRNPDFKPFFDTLGFAELQVSDLRQVGTTPIQSNLDLYSNVHNRYSPGNISYFSIDSGPVYNFRYGKIRTAIGGEYVLQGRSPLETTNHSRQFEFDSGNFIFNYLPPETAALQSVNLLVGYDNFRQSNSFRSGPVIRLTAPVLVDRLVPFPSLLLATPGYVLNGAREQSEAPLEPAHYNEVNLDLLGLAPLAQSRLGAGQVLGVYGLFLAGDFYNNALPSEGPNRRDFRIVPRIGIRLADFLVRNLQLDVDYRYDRNFSNEFIQSYRDNIFSLTLTSHF
jgi:hypothetical protein